jgi:hypothetical protein
VQQENVSVTYEGQLEVRGDRITHGSRVHSLRIINELESRFSLTEAEFIYFILE